MASGKNVALLPFRFQNIFLNFFQIHYSCVLIGRGFSPHRRAKTGHFYKFFVQFIQYVFQNFVIADRIFFLENGHFSSFGVLGRWVRPHPCASSRAKQWVPHALRTLPPPAERAQPPLSKRAAAGAASREFGRGKAMPGFFEPGGPPYQSASN